jgi:hypothetical protein
LEEAIDEDCGIDQEKKQSDQLTALLFTLIWKDGLVHQAFYHTRRRQCGLSAVSGQSMSFFPAFSSFTLLYS